MFDSCITFILDELNSYLKAKASLKDNPLILTKVNNFDENKKDIKSKLQMFLVDIMNEDFGNSNNEYIPQGNSYVVRNKPVYFSLYLLITVSELTHKNLESLALLSHVAAFFQSKSYFDNENTPNFQKVGVDRLKVELVKLNHQERQAFWSVLGLTYIPSLLYKVGHCAIADTNAFDTVPTLKETTVSLSSTYSS